MEIIPAIMPQSIYEIEQKVTPMVGRVDTIQLDIMDGVFTKRTTWPYIAEDVSFDAIENEEEGMPFWDKVDYELDLMISDPEEKFKRLVQIGPARIIFHIESLANPASFFESLDQYYKDTIEFGIALNTTTNISSVFPLVDAGHVKFVQCMGIEKIGYQGNPFDERVFDHIGALREKYPELMISVDGSVNQETAGRLLDAGADRLVIGSAIYNSDNPIGELDFFKSL